MHLAYADLHVMTELHSTGKWESFATLYFSTLAAGMDIALRHRGSGQWYFGLPVSCPRPADVAMEGGRVTHLRPCLESRPQWLGFLTQMLGRLPPIVGSPLCSRSLPLQRPAILSAVSLGSVSWPGSSCAKIISEAASQAFWDIPKAALVWFVRYYGLEVSSSNQFKQLGAAAEGTCPAHPAQDY